MPKRIPWVAALLNFILPGSGYLYIGKRQIFAFLLMGGAIVQLTGDFFIKGHYAAQDWRSYEWMTSFILLLAFAFDAYHEAKKL